MEQMAGTIFEQIRSRLTGKPMKFKPKPTCPVRVMQGSKEKLSILANRLERGEELWHEDDGVPDDE